MLRHLACVVVLGLTACGSSDPGPGGITANEAKALDEAAEMVEGQRLADDAVKPQEPAQVAPPAK